jgi:hypothetical protein
VARRRFSVIIKSAIFQERRLTPWGMAVRKAKGESGGGTFVSIAPHAQAKEKALVAVWAEFDL